MLQYVFWEIIIMFFASCLKFFGVYMMPSIAIPAPSTPHTHTNQDSDKFSKWEKELKWVQKWNFKYCIKLSNSGNKISSNFFPTNTLL